MVGLLCDSRSPLRYGGNLYRSDQEARTNSQIFTLQRLDVPDTTVSGILVHIFRYIGLPLATYYTYSVHLVIAVAMLVVEVPFGKWAHLLYRPLAIYFKSVKDKALQQQVPKEAILENV